MAMTENWEAGPIRTLCHAAIEEMNGQRCTVCQGVASRLIDGKTAVCEHCNGTGIHRINNREIARRLGISERQYHRKWKDRYNRIVAMLRRWDDGIRSTLKNQLTELS
jgi:hypothetical protein